MFIKLSILIVALLINLVLAFFVVYQNRRNKVNIIYGSFVISIFFWILTNLLFQALDHKTTLYVLSILSYHAALGCVYFLFYFSLIFPEIRKEYKRLKITVLILTIFIVIFTSIPGVVLKDIQLEPEKALVTNYGLNVYGLYLIVFFTWSLINLFRSYRKANKGIDRQRLKFVFLGIFCAVSGGVFFNLILPLLKVYVFVWLGPVFTILMTAFFAYAILRYRLMNIKLIITRSLIFFFLTLTVAATFVLVSSLSAMFFTGTLGANQYVVWLITAVIIVVSLDPLKDALAKETDKIFFKGKVNYDKMLKTLTKMLAEEVRVERIVNEVNAVLRDKLKIKSVRFFIALSEEYFLSIGSGSNNSKGNNDQNGEVETDKNPNSKQDSKLRIVGDEQSCHIPGLLAFLYSDPEIIIKEELERKIYDMAETEEAKKLRAAYKDIEILSADLVVPVIREGKITGLLLLGSKTSGDVFGDEDVSMLEMLAPQLASSLFKANLFQEANLFNIKLQKEVERATKSLKRTNMSLADRNKNLTTLQKFSNTILSGLETKKVAQKIIDDIPIEINGCINALLALVDKSGKYLRGKSLPLSVPGTHEIFKIVGTRLYKYKVSLAKDDNLLIKAVKTQKHQISESFKDFFSPPLDNKLCTKVQKVEPIMQSGVAFPLVVNKKVLGVLFFSLDKKSVDIAENDFQMMQAVSDEIALALERAEFLERLKKMNKELQNANEHLQELDNAKSEFMSIASHQLRTPLSGIMGYLSMIMEGDYGKMPKDQEPIVKEVFEASQRLIRLVNLFLNVTRIEAGRLKFDWTEVDFDKLVTEQVHELKPAADKKGLQLTMKKTKDVIPKMTVDADKIKDVILNLIDNAIKYTEKGKIEVSVENEDKSHVHVRVKDNGLGIDPEKAGELFNKFVRGDGMVRVNPDGSGLGLFIARKITEGHNGKIWAESKGLNKGSTFNVVLPLKQKPLSIQIKKSKKA